MSCNHTASETPKTIELNSRVVSLAGNCTVSARQMAEHKITAANLTNFTLRIDVDANCISPFINYRGLAGPQNAWQATIFVPPRPGWGGAEVAHGAAQLISGGQGAYQEIQTTLTWAVVGADTSRSETLYAQVHTTW